MLESANNLPENLFSDVMTETQKRVALTIGLLPVTAVGVYFIRRVLASWGVLDPFADVIGGWLKLNVSTAQLINLVGLIAFIVLYGIALFVIWQRRRSVSHVLQETILSAEPISSTPIIAKRDTKMDEALAYIETGEWGGEFYAFANNPAQNPRKGLSTVKVRQAAIDKEIRVWGATTLNEDAHVEIDPKYWEDWQIDLLSAMKGETKTEKRHSHASGFKYYNLMVSKAEFEARWRSAYRDDSFNVALDTSDRKIGAFHTLLSLRVQNTGDTPFTDCIVKIIDRKSEVPIAMSSQPALRTEGQIKRGEGRSRFKLSINESKTLPLLFYNEHRRNEWYFIEESGEHHFLPTTKGRPIVLLIGVYGGAKTVTVLITVESGENWTALPTIKRVPNDFVLNREKRA
jgi:hypothetical protein